MNQDWKCYLCITRILFLYETEKKIPDRLVKNKQIVLLDRPQVCRWIYSA